MGQDTCPNIGDFPDDYSSLLPKHANVPTSETSPPGKTWYFPLRLDKANPTGVFVPQHYVFPKKGDKVDIILFFHGSKVGKFSDPPNDNINYYWSNNYEYQGDILKLNLREDLNTSRRNALLVAPTMGHDPGFGGSQSAALGIFKEPGGGDCFLKHVMAWLGHYDPRFASTSVGNVVLAGHSGGGNPINLMMNTLTTADVCEVWGFDVVFGLLEAYFKCASRLEHNHPNALMTFFFGVQSSPYFKSLRTMAKDRGRIYKKEDRTTNGGKNNMRFEEGRKDHFGTLTDHFLEQLQSPNTCLTKV